MNWGRENRHVLVNNLGMTSQPTMQHLSKKSPKVAINEHWIKTTQPGPASSASSCIKCISKGQQKCALKVLGGQVYLGQQQQHHPLPKLL